MPALVLVLTTVSCGTALAALPRASLSGATVATPQIRATVSAFTIPAKGKCVDVPVGWKVIAPGRGYVELSIVDSTEQKVALDIAGMGDHRKFPKDLLTICRKRDESMGLFPIDPDEDYRLKLVYQASRKSPEVSAYSALRKQG